MPKVLLVDDDLEALTSTQKILEMAGIEVITAQDGHVALEWIRPSTLYHKSSIQQQSLQFDLVISDVRMPRLGGLELLKALNFYNKNIPFIMITAYGSVEDAVTAIKLGALDFLTKPFKRQALLSAIDVALKCSANFSSLSASSVCSTLIGNSEVMKKLEELVQKVASTQAPVLLTGESGTGKERVAKHLHQLSVRSQGPFIVLNCAAVPESLLESELFGFEKGSFTGANFAKKGLFEAADGGTLFLDEIGDMPLVLQPKILRALQDGEVRRLGSTVSKKVDIRIIAATHQNLDQAVQCGRFRQDLLYRLEVVGISIPPLRHRGRDSIDLAYYFLNIYSEKHHKKIQKIHPEALEALLYYSWPGNVRELANVIERAVIFSNEDLLTVQDLPERLLGSKKRELFLAENSISIPFGTSLKDVEELLIRKTLEATSGDKVLAAKLLGIHSRTIYRKLDKT